MAKKIKFPLKLKDDFQVRTLEELKEHFDLDKIVPYFLDGKLLIWLKARYYEPEVKAVRNLRKNDPELQKKLCQIFGMEYSDYNLDINEVEERNRRLGLLRQFTSDPTVLEQVASVAFNQEDLGDLLDDGVRKIFLCNNSFVIPLSIEDKTYIGIGKATAVIRSTEKIDFGSKHISFQDISFDPDYQKLIDSEIIVPQAPQKDFYQLGLDAENSGDYNSAIDFYLKALEENNNADVNFKLGWCYASINDYVKAYPYYLKAANLGNTRAMNNISVLFFNGQGVSQNYAKGREWIEQAANNGYEHSRYWLGRYIFYGQFGYSKNRYEGKQIIEQAAYNGNSNAMFFLGKMEGSARYRKKLLEQNVRMDDDNDIINYFQGTVEEEENWLRMAANAGNAEAMYELFNLNLYDSAGKGICGSPTYVLSDAERFEWIKKAAELGHFDSMEKLYFWLYRKKKNFSESLKWVIKAAEASKKQSYKHKLEYYSESGTDYGLGGSRLGVKKDLNEIYEGDPDLLDDIKKVFPWFYPGI